MNTISAHQLACIRKQKLLFDNISFHLNAGEALVVEGPNGSGKSSLLRLLVGLAAPCAGEICWQGKSIFTQQLLYNEILHYIGHTNGIKLGLTVKENLQLSAHLNLTTMPLTLSSILEMLKLQAHQHTPARDLSAGQKRKLALARLYLFPKSLWVLDEPLTALDKETQHYFLAHLHQHLQSGGIAILSSHHAITLEPSLTKKTLRLSEC